MRINDDGFKGNITGLNRLFQQACLAIPMDRAVVMMMERAMKHTETEQESESHGQGLTSHVHGELQ